MKFGEELSKNGQVFLKNILKALNKFNNKI